MFTVEQIMQAHSKVKSGAEFPAYIREIKSLGVTYYETHVINGHTDYYGSNEYKTSTAGMYDALMIAEASSAQQFKSNLKEHQQGKTDYLTFVGMCATFGIEKWEVCIGSMTCTYFDKAGNRILVEEIPQ